MGTDMINENVDFNLNEVTNPLNMDDYTGDNVPSKCFNIEKNEYAFARENEEFFASIDDDTIVLSIKEDERLFAKGDFSALQAFSFLYQKNHLIDNKLFIISNNNFDIDSFNELMEKIGNDNIYYEHVDDKDFEYCINALENEIKISNGKGSINSIELNDHYNKVR